NCSPIVGSSLTTPPSRLCFQKRQDLKRPARLLLIAHGWIATIVIWRRQSEPAARRKLGVLVMMIVEGESDLPQIVLAGDPIGALADFLHGGQQKPHQDADDRDHDQQLDQRERGAAGGQATLHVFHRSHSRTSVPGVAPSPVYEPAWQARTVPGPGPRKSQPLE